MSATRLICGVFLLAFAYGEDILRREETPLPFRPLPRIGQSLPPSRMDHVKGHGFQTDHAKTPDFQTGHEKTPDLQTDPEKTPDFQMDHAKAPAFHRNHTKTPDFQTDPAKTPDFQTDPEKTPDFPTGPVKVQDFPTDGEDTFRLHMKDSLLLKYSAIDIHSVPGSCREFYYCEDMTEDMTGEIMERRRAFRFCCPIGTIFDVENKKCTDSFLSVPVPSDCQPDKLTRADEAFEAFSHKTPLKELSNGGIIQNAQVSSRLKRSVNEYCAEGVVENVVSSTLEPCGDIDNIDNYVKRIRAMFSVKLLPSYEEPFKHILMDYNKDLSDAKVSTYSWRNTVLNHSFPGSVLNAIKETISLVQEFEPTFNREFDIFAERIGIIIDTEDALTTIEYRSNENLEKQIRELKEMLSISTSKNDLQTVQFLERKLEQLEEDLKNQTHFEISQLITFLELVRNEADKIKVKAEAATSSITVFKGNIVRYESQLKRHQSVTTIALVNLEKKEKENQIEINNLGPERARLLRIISNAQREIASQFKKQQGLLQEKNWILKQLGRRSKRSPMNPAVVVGGMTALGGLFYGLFNNDDGKRRKIHALETQLFHVDRSLRIMRTQMSLIIRDINDYNNRLITIQRASQHLKIQIKNYRALNVLFQIVLKHISSVQPSIIKARTSILKIIDIFKNVVQQKLDTLINEAKTAETDLKQKNILYFIYNEISNMKCIWDRVSDKMATLDGCD